MIPVFQTKLHERGKVNGNCLAAGVASILEIDIGLVPAFEDMRSTVWFGWMVCWLDGFTASKLGPSGLTCYYLEPEEIGKIEQGEILLASGNSPRSGLTLRSSFMHVVVWQKNDALQRRPGKVLHDPHPSGDGLDGDPTGFYLIRRKQ